MTDSATSESPDFILPPTWNVQPPLGRAVYTLTRVAEYRQGRRPGLPEYPNEDAAVSERNRVIEEVFRLMGARLSGVGTNGNGGGYPSELECSDLQDESALGQQNELPK